MTDKQNEQKQSGAMINNDSKWRLIWFNIGDTICDNCGMHRAYIGGNYYYRENNDKIELLCQECYEDTTS